MNPRGGGCGELRSHHCTPAWVTRVKFCLKKIKIKKINTILTGQARWLTFVILAVWEAKADYLTSGV